MVRWCDGRCGAPFRVRSVHGGTGSSNPLCSSGESPTTRARRAPPGYSADEKSALFQRRIAGTSMGNLLRAQYFVSDLTAFPGIAMAWSAKLGAQPHPFVCIQTPPVMPAPGVLLNRRFLDFRSPITRRPGNSVWAQVRRCGRLLPKGAGSISGLDTSARVLRKPSAKHIPFDWGGP
jgi:hypothetical protein